MANLAQEEADRFFSANGRDHTTSHPEDRDLPGSSGDEAELDARSDARQRTAIRSGYTSRRRRHDVDSSDEDQNDNDNDNDSDVAHPSAFGSKDRYTVPHAKSYANTGPKGVIADAQHYTTSRSQNSITSRLQRQQLTSGNAEADGNGDGNGVKWHERRSDDDDDDDLNDAEGEDEFMKEWRRTRMDELKQSTSRSAGGVGGTGAGAGTATTAYGRLEEVNADGYLDAIEGRTSPISTAVVVFIHDRARSRTVRRNYNYTHEHDDDDDDDDDQEGKEESEAVYDEIRALAYKFPTIRFLGLGADVADMQHIAVPALLVYRSGAVVMTVSGVKAGDARGGGGGGGGIEGLLRRGGVL